MISHEFTLCSSPIYPQTSKMHRWPHPPETSGGCGLKPSRLHWQNMVISPAKHWDLTQKTLGG